MVSAVLALNKDNAETGINQHEIECLKKYLGFDNEEELKSYLKHYFLEWLILPLFNMLLCITIDTISKYYNIY